MRRSKWFSTFLLCLPLLTSSVLANYVPSRGMSMHSVKAQYGQPQAVTRSSGPVKPQWPRITVWHYSGFSVYFERSTVLHTVVH